MFDITVQYKYLHWGSPGRQTGTAMRALCSVVCFSLVLCAAALPQEAPGPAEQPAEGVDYTDVHPDHMSDLERSERADEDSKMTNMSWEWISWEEFLWRWIDGWHFWKCQMIENSCKKCADLSCMLKCFEKWMDCRIKNIKIKEKIPKKKPKLLT